MNEKSGKRVYQICSRCVMDTSDPDIVFDSQGICNHCQFRDEQVKRFVLEGKAREESLEKILGAIKKGGKGKEYDCIIGVSGGADSTYATYLVKKMGLRPLAVHLDNGWDSELAVKNIENILGRLNIDLYTHVIDWEEFKDLQLSFIRAGTPDWEIPTDHAINAIVRKRAKASGVRYIVFGTNLTTETHLPRAWSQGHLDWKYIKAVHERFGSVRLRTFPHMSIWSYFWFLATQNTFEVLNYVDYIRDVAANILRTELCWKDYGSKHFESVYTRFYQGYILPRKFGFDKRRCHFSSLICSGQMSRREALDALEEDVYPIEVQAQDKAYFLKKLGLSEEEFEVLMKSPQKGYASYPSYRRIMTSSVYRMARNLYHRYFKLV